MSKTAGKASTEWRKLARSDIKTFPKQAQEIILEAQRNGALCRINGNGHVVIRSPHNEETMWVSRNSGRGYTSIDKVKADLNRLFPSAQYDTITVPDELPPIAGFRTETQECIIMALQLGWEYVPTTRGSKITIKSFDLKKSLEFPPGRLPGHLTYDMVRKIIVDHGDQLRRATILAGLEGGVKLTDREAYIHTATQFLLSPEPEPIVPDDGLVSTPFGRAAFAEADTPDPVPVAPPAVASGERRVVSSGPFMVRGHAGSSGSPGKRYPSPVVGEHIWSDGTRELFCLAGEDDKCDWPSTEDATTPSDLNVRRIARHSRAHKTTPQGEPSQPRAEARLMVDDPDYLEPTYHKGYTPRADRVEALVRHLRGLDIEDASLETLVEEVLKWIHDQSESRSHLAAEREPLTAEQILDRVRSLVDHGEYMAQRDELELLALELEETKQRAAKAEADAESCRARADGLAGNLGALRELIDEMGPNTSGE